MDIKYRKIYVPIIILCSVLIMLLLSGCTNYLPIEAESIEMDYDVSDPYIEDYYEYENDYENDYDISDPYIEEDYDIFDPYIEEDYESYYDIIPNCLLNESSICYAPPYELLISNNPFHGLWILEKVVLERISSLYQIEAEWAESDVWKPKRVNVRDFLGYELEITKNFVRLGNRRLFYQDTIQFFSSMGIDARFNSLFEPTINWIPSYYNSPRELLNSLYAQGVNLGLCREGSEDIYSLLVSFVYFDSVRDHELYLTFDNRISIPLDPVYPEYMLNPLFSSLLMLSYDHILAGMGGTELILARRIE